MNQTTAGVMIDQPHILQVVPFRTSRNDGIGDYARVLAGSIELHCGARTAFLSGTPEGVLAPPDDRWTTTYVRAQSRSAFVEALGAATMR